MEQRRQGSFWIAIAFAIFGLALAPVAALAQESGAREAAEVDGLRLVEITLARNYESGQAIDPTHTFSVNDGRVWVLLRIENSTGAETDIRVSFERADRELGEASGAGVTLHVPDRRRHRTVARAGTRAPGRYRVVVRTAEGNVLGTAEYEIAT